MKKFSALLLTLFMVTSLASCGDKDSSKTDKSSSGKTPETEAATSPAEDIDEDEDTAPDEDDDGNDNWWLETEDESSADTDITGKTLADVNYDNYSPMVKREFGIDISEEDGWKINFPVWDVSSYMDNGVSIHTFYQGTDILELMKTYYDRCSEVASDGIWDYNYLWYTHDDPLNTEELKTFEQCFDEWNSDTVEVESRCDVRWAYTYNDQIVFFWIERTSECSVDIKIEFKPENE